MALEEISPDDIGKYAAISPFLTSDATRLQTCCCGRTRLQPLKLRKAELLKLNVMCRRYSFQFACGSAGNRLNSGRAIINLKAVSVGLNRSTTRMAQSGGLVTL